MSLGDLISSACSSDISTAAVARVHRRRGGGGRRGRPRTERVFDGHDALDHVKAVEPEVRLEVGGHRELRRAKREACAPDASNPQNRHEGVAARDGRCGGGGGGHVVGPKSRTGTLPPPAPRDERRKGAAERGPQTFSGSILSKQPSTESIFCSTCSCVSAGAAPP